MSFFSDWKLKSICRKEGRLQEYEIYKKRLKLAESDIERFKGYIEKAERYFQEVKRKYPEGSKEYLHAQNEIKRWKYYLYEEEVKLEFIRPNSPKDIEYRDKQGVEFTKKLREAISPNLDLRFHGTPIYFAKQIIESGQISSSADRHEGYISSTDLPGEISASSVDTIEGTINYFSDVYGYVRSLPAGCIFAIYPKDKEDATLGTNLLHSVDFRKNPEQLFGVFTSPENIDRVKGWMQEFGFNQNQVYTFEGFLQAVREKSKEIDFRLGHNGTLKVSDEHTQEKSSGTRELYSFGEKDAEKLAAERRSGTIVDLQQYVEMKNSESSKSTDDNNEGQFIKGGER